MKPRGKDRRRFKRKGDDERRSFIASMPSIDSWFFIVVGLSVATVIGMYAYVLVKF